MTTPEAFRSELFLDRALELVDDAPKVSPESARTSNLNHAADLIAAALFELENAVAAGEGADIILRLRGRADSLGKRLQAAGIELRTLPR